MKKLALLFTIVCVSQSYGMETSWYDYCANTVSHTYSYIASFFTSKPSILQELRNDKNKFKQELLLNTDFELDRQYKKNTSPIIDPNMPNLYNYLKQSVIGNSAISAKFFQYCYFHQRFDKDEIEKDMQVLITTPDLRYMLVVYKRELVNGYSAIGAAIIAPDVSIENKREFIQQLLDLGFKPTKKDIMLAELQLYDAIPAEKKTEIVAFLSRKDMPKDVTKKIVNCMIDAYRQEYWPLPEITGDEK